MSTPNPMHSRRAAPAMRPKIKLKLLYELNGSSCLARTQFPVDVFAANDIAFANFKQCFSAINSASPEILASASETDYAVYVADCTEADEPMVGRGLLSQLLARPEVDISDTSTLLTGGVVSGRITSSLLSFIPGHAQETVEIRLRFVTIQKASQIASLMSMFLYSSIQQSLNDNQVSQICDGRWISDLQEQGIWEQLLEFKNSVLSEDDNPARRIISPKKALSPFQSSPVIVAPALPAPSINPDEGIRLVGKISDPQSSSGLLSSSPSRHQTIIRSGRAQEIDRAKEQTQMEKENGNECYNCRTLHASSWRKCTTHDDDGVFTIILCNPCGLWFVNKKEHRPRKYWGKMRDGRPIPPSKRGPRKKSDKTTIVKAEKKPVLKMHDRPLGIQATVDLTDDSRKSLPPSQHPTPVPSHSMVQTPAGSTPMSSMGSAPVSGHHTHGLSRTHVQENALYKKRPFQALTQSLQQPPVFDNPQSMASRTTSLPVSDRGAKRPKTDAPAQSDPVQHTAAYKPVHFQGSASSPAVTPTMESTATMPSSPGIQTRSSGAAVPGSPARTNSASSGTPFLQPKALPPLPPITPQKVRLTPSKKDKTPDFLVGLSPSRWLSAYLGSSRSPSQFSNNTSPVDHNNVNFFSDGDLFTESPFRGLYQGVRSEPFTQNTAGTMPPPSADDDYNMNVLPSSPSIFRLYKDNSDLFSSSSQSTEATSPINKLQQIARNSPDAHKSLEESEEIGNTNSTNKA
ncbi:hypothetical protein CKK34_6366 [Yarrowia sp. E02]|nr:hypothetical protein CKK34_6366 [Yarrowia sp. E02]